MRQIEIANQLLRLRFKTTQSVCRGACVESPGADSLDMAANDIGILLCQMRAMSAIRDLHVDLPSLARECSWRRKIDVSLVRVDAQVTGAKCVGKSTS